MNILFIDTSGKDVSISIVRDNEVLAFISKELPNKHSIYTVSLIEEVLKNTSIEPTGIDRILVVTGPGSFTGVRIGVTIAKTYAYLNNIPVIPVSSLKLLALSTTNDYILSIIDAKHDNYYIGLYDKNYNEVIKEQFTSKDYLLELIAKYNPKLISNEELIINNIKIEKINISILKIVSYYKTLPSINPHLLVPNYLKLPSALEAKND